VRIIRGKPREQNFLVKLNSSRLTVVGVGSFDKGFTKVVSPSDPMLLFFKKHKCFTVKTTFEPVQGKIIEVKPENLPHESIDIDPLHNPDDGLEPEPTPDDEAKQDANFEDDPIEVLGLDKDTIEALKKNGLTSIAHIFDLDDEALMEFNGIGEARATKIIQAINAWENNKE